LHHVIINNINDHFPSCFYINKCVFYRISRLAVWKYQNRGLALNTLKKLNGETFAFPSHPSFRSNRPRSDGTLQIPL
jgi:hypothetical protein